MGKNDLMFLFHRYFGWSVGTKYENPGYMSSILCDWFQRIPPHASIEIKATIYVPDDDAATIYENSEKFKDFDIPYIRPAKEWITEGSGHFTLTFELSESSVKTTPKFESTIPIDLQSELPTELAELPEPLIYHGIAHPDIHHISRRHRKASQSRPRHFHSPVRKERRKSSWIQRNIK